MENKKKEYSVDELLMYAYKHNQIPEVLFAKDKECRYIYTSEIEDLINGGEEHSILGKTDMDIQYDPELGKLYYEQDQEIIRTGKPCHCYSEFIENGRIIYREISKNPVYIDGEIIGICGVVSDVTELMAMKKKFETLTVTDTLTGMYNRNYFLNYDFDRPVCLPCTYIMCDCNNLKGVNDQIGHEAGDCYIREAADLLSGVIPDRGICIRWGGDEFLLIIPDCSYEESQNLVEEIEWLEDAGVVSVCHCLQYPELPLKGNYDDSKFKLYYPDTGLLIASLDEEAQEDLRANKNLGVYKGALYENFVAEAFIKQGLGLYYYKKENATLEEDFFVRTKDELVPVEVKSNNNRSRSLRQLISNEGYGDIHWGIKLADSNIGIENDVCTFPYFCTFLMKRYLAGR